MKKKQWAAIMLAFAASTSMAGCAIRKDQLSGHDSELPPTKIYKIVNGETIQLKDMAELMFGKTPAELEEYVFQNHYGIDGKELTVSKGHTIEGLDMTSETQMLTSVRYNNLNDGINGCYELALSSPISGALESGTMRDCFPQENIEACSKEEAIEICYPYAAALGYAESEVAVYAATVDLLKSFTAVDVNMDGTTEYYYSAPGPGYEPMSWKEYVERSDKLRELESKGELDKQGKEELDLIVSYFHMGGAERDIPWEEKHEVMILVYSQELEGYPLLEDFLSTRIIYSPLYEEVIWIEAGSPFVAVEELEEVTPISEEEAIECLMRIKGIPSIDNIEIEETKLLYAIQEKMEGYLYQPYAIPCWQIYYVRNGVRNRVLIDAQYGTEYTRYPTS